MNSSLDCLTPLIEHKGIVKDHVEFHKKVNVIFHDFEAKEYDFIHKEMWHSLPRQYQLLVDDIIETLPAKQLKVLDIGCGTGLSTKLLLNSALGEKIGEISLLDTSSEMLNKAKKRFSKTKKRINYIHGDVSTVSGTFDLILISSVLHHIPDLKSLSAKLSNLQEQGGTIMTVHDPSSESLHNNSFQTRCKEFNEYPKKNNKPVTSRLFNKVRRIH